MKFDIYKITDRVFSRYGEMRVAEELQKMGFDVFEPLNDSYIDLVARIRKCRKCGSFLMNPTVSVTKTFWFFGNSTVRVVGSSVAKSLFSASWFADVRTLNKVDFPAFV